MTSNQKLKIETDDSDYQLYDIVRVWDNGKLEKSIKTDELSVNEYTQIKANVNKFNYDQLVKYHNDMKKYKINNDINLSDQITRDIFYHDLNYIKGTEEYSEEMIKFLKSSYLSDNLKEKISSFCSDLSSKALSHYDCEEIDKMISSLNDARNNDLTTLMMLYYFNIDTTESLRYFNERVNKTVVAQLLLDTNEFISSSEYYILRGDPVPFIQLEQLTNIFEKLWKINKKDAVAFYRFVKRLYPLDYTKFIHSFLSFSRLNFDIERIGLIINPRVNDGSRDAVDVKLDFKKYVKQKESIKNYLKEEKYESIIS